MPEELFAEQTLLDLTPHKRKRNNHIQLNKIILKYNPLILSPDYCLTRVNTYLTHIKDFNLDIFSLKKTRIEDYSDVIMVCKTNKVFKSIKFTFQKGYPLANNSKFRGF